MGKRLVQQARGRGGPTYRVPGFRSIGFARHISVKAGEVTGKIVDILHCSQHSAPFASVEYSNGENGFIHAPEGISVGEQISVGCNEVEVGNCLKLKNIPEGTLVYNIEIVPGDGGRICKASGTFARVAAKLPQGILVTLPSKKQKVFVEDCRANIGIIAGAGRLEKPILKAGNMYHKTRTRNRYWPVTKGHSQNAVDHPFGNKRSSRKSKARPAPKNAPPGRNVGMLHPRRTGRKK